MNHPQTSKQAKNQTINTYIAKQVHAVFKFKYKISYLHKSMGLVIQRFILSALISLREIGRNVRKQYCETLAQKCRCRLRISLLIQVINCKMPTDIERHHHFMDACIINCSRKLIHWNLFLICYLNNRKKKNKLCHNKIMSPSFSFPFISINVFFSSIFVSMFFSRCNHLHLVLHRSIIQRNESRRRSKYWSTNGLRRWNNKSTKSTSTIQCANHRQMNNNNLQTEL